MKKTNGEKMALGDMRETGRKIPTHLTYIKQVSFSFILNSCKFCEINVKIVFFFTLKFCNFLARKRRKKQFFLK